MKIFNYYSRSKKKWIVEVKDESNSSYIAESFICDSKSEAEQQEEKILQKYGHFCLYSWMTDNGIRELLHTHSIDCKVKNVMGSKVRVMFYNPTENYIGFNNDYIKRFCLNNLLPVNEAIKAMTYHEIGHWIDCKLNPITSETITNKERIEREVRAFRYVRYLVPDDLLLLYDDINYSNIRNYENKYKII
ncbi:hypothetical protein ACFVQB_14755 [Paenibacillus sp. NPDC057886]|uniref:hypothetical protein n=1 Tax=Paenibacillus sp. NPDC057886 TaxID=3346270 RepID=UPI0036AB308E